MPARIADRVWTREMIIAQGVRMSGLDACEAVLGLRPTKAYRLLAAAADGDKTALPFPVFATRGARAGHRGRYVVPTAAVLRVLGLADGETA